MTFPSTRLIWAAALVLVPTGAAVAAPKVPTAPFLGLTLAAAAAALADAFMARGSLEGMTVEAPELLRLTRHQEGSLGLLIKRGRGRLPGLTLALDLPAGLATGMETAAPAFTGGHGAVRVTWPVVGRRRGRYHISGLAVRVLSPMGLWHRQEKRPLPTRVHVYPNLFSERRQLAAHFLDRGDMGAHAQRPVGKGREFEKLRDYVPGDSPTDIHWKASARRGQLVTKEFQIERTQEIYVAIDASRLSGRTGAYITGSSSDEDPVIENYINAALILGMVAQRQGDLFGLMTFSNRMEGFLRAGSGSAHFRACRDTLYDLFPGAVNPDFAELSSFINTRLRKRVLIFLLTSLDDRALAESFKQDMEVVNRRHLVMVNTVKPSYAAPLFTGDPVANTAEIYGRLAGHMALADLKELRISLKRRGMDMYMLDRESVSSRLVSQYMEIKRRQIL